MTRRLFMLFLVIFAFHLPAFANENLVTVKMQLTEDGAKPKYAGTISIQKTEYGLLFVPHLKNLTPGAHGFHIHENASCGDKGMAAGGHLDPKKTNRHLGPYNDSGHLGDLPILYVNDKGIADTPVLAPRLTLKEVKNHALMIHAGGDNYSDQPQKLGGGGARVLCGVIQ